jgi:hypothetical protein
MKTHSKTNDDLNSFNKYEVFKLAINLRIIIIVCSVNF